ncbi:hypothetical protein [Pseudonocardia oroxyli]|uniref:Uncharacterized protein n=1 Tax=Pseudonocardia oroxyli TaxID=366584 RepID=A0A1G7Z9M1_PSEOR|nr:hypothetical protein [Pseudonocardia oroxyli]SDH05297.1 hypothetical protein SAMN05216377_11870 [Pseudonocardia oroxyli]
MPRRRTRHIRPREPEPEQPALATRVLRLVGSVVAPATVLTALLLYFGRLHAQGLADYFGLQYSVLDLTTQDFVVRSADGLILPAALTACAVLLALWAHWVLTRALPPPARQRALRVVIPVAAVLGCGLVTLALVDAFTPGELFDPVGELRGLCLAIGAPLLVYAVRLARTAGTGRSSGGTALAEWTAAFALVSVGLFWAAGTYAVGVGTGRARQIADLLGSMPDVTVFSEKDLNLDGQPGVSVQRCPAPERAYGYRYSGLRLVLQSGSQYLLLPVGWSVERGAAILLPRQGGVRLEFGWRSDWRPTGC